MTALDPFNPSLSLLAKLGSIAIHAEELLSPGKHASDVAAIRTLLDDAEVKQWIKRHGRCPPCR